MNMLQQLKNKYYKYWYILVYSFKQSNIKIFSFFVFRLAVIIQFCLTIYVWLLFNNDSNLITYLLVGYIIQKLAWTNVTNYLARSIFTNTITNQLLLPINYTAYLFFRELGSRLIPNLFSALIICLLLPFFASHLTAPSGVFILIIPVLLILGFCIDFLASYSIAMTTFWLKDGFDSVAELVAAITNIFTGLYIPFQFLPSPLKNILPFNPYAWMNYHPMQIYLGNYSTNQILLTLLGGVGWIITLYFISQLVFKLGLKKYESEGL